MRKKTLIISCLLAGTLGLSSCNALIYKIYHIHSYEDGDESVLYVDGEWYQYCTICGGIGDVVTNTTGYTHVVEDAEGLSAAFKFSGTTALISNITSTSALSVASGMAIELNLNYYDLTLSNGMVIDGDLVITNSSLRAETSNPIESEDEEEEEVEKLEELNCLDYYDIVTYADDDEPDDDDGDDDPDTETEPGPVEEPVPTGGAEEITVSGQGIIVNSTGTLGVIDNVLIDTTDCSNLITVNGGLVNLYSGQISSEIDGETTDECAINVTNSGILNVIGGEIEADDIGVLASDSGNVYVTGGSVAGTHAGVVVEDAALSVTDGTISSSQGQGIIVRESDSTSAPIINVSGVGTTISAPSGAGILILHQYSITSITGGAYVTGLTGVEIHAGDLTVDESDTYLVGNGLFSDVRYEYEDVDKTFTPVEDYEVDPDTNYVCGCGVAIVREEADISVTINGGNIIAGDNLEYALYLNEEEVEEHRLGAKVIDEVITPTISLIVNDGFFYGKLSVSLSGFIYGGTFAETGYTNAEAFNETAYIAEGYEAVELDGYFVVGETISD